MPFLALAPLQIRTTLDSSLKGEKTKVMDKSRLLAVALPFSSIIFLYVFSNVALGSPLFSAMYVFGDSLVDDGNNNYLNSLAKANYPPYGIDFSRGVTGRFNNGKTVIDFLGEMLDLPYLPAFADTRPGDSTVLQGVNYASAAAGILDETGRNLGDRYTIGKQVQNFETTLSQLKNLMVDKNLSQHLAHSLTVVSLGSNDYLNNYLLPAFYDTSYIYDPKDYADLLIDRYRSHILALRDLGLRKFFLAAVGPLGCIPNQLARGLVPPGQCVSSVNDITQLFNARLRSLVDQLNADHHEAIFVYGNTFGAVRNMINDPDAFGFTVSDRACCGVGRNQGLITCLPLSIPCTNRDQYVFWDAFHPSQAANEILARKAFSGPPSDCYPVNVKQMAQKKLSS